MNRNTQDRVKQRKELDMVLVDIN